MSEALALRPVRIAAVPAPMAAAADTILYMDGVSVSFDGFKALNALTLSISAGELRCIIGPNGAGKTTMMDVITGKTRPDAGRAFFGSTIDLLRLREDDIASIGIGRKFQKPTVFEQLSVFENLELALKDDRGVKASMFFRLSGEQLDRIGETLSLIHLKDSAQQRRDIAQRLAGGEDLDRAAELAEVGGVEGELVRRAGMTR